MSGAPRYSLTILEWDALRMRWAMLDLFMDRKPHVDVELSTGRVRIKRRAA